MGIPKGKFIVFVLLIELLGCKRYDIDNLESSFKLPLKDNLQYITIKENWNGFNGDGEKVILFKIHKIEPIRLFDMAKKQGFEEVDFNNVVGIFSEIEQEFIEGNVLYKNLFHENEIETLTIDTLSGMVIYSLTIL